MNIPWTALDVLGTEIRVYYTNDTPPPTIAGCIIAWYRVIYIAGVPQELSAMFDRTDFQGLESTLLHLLATTPSLACPTYIGIKDGKPI